VVIYLLSGGSGGLNLHGLQGFFPGVASTDPTSKTIAESHTDMVTAGTLIGDDYVKEIEMRLDINDPHMYELDGVVMDEETLQTVDQFDMMDHPDEMSATRSFNRSGDAVEEDEMSLMKDSFHHDDEHFIDSPGENEEQTFDEDGNIIIDLRDDSLGDSRSHRALSTADATGVFESLSCNDNLSSQGCGTSVSYISSLSPESTLVIPCGQCYTWDLDGNYTFNKGIDIIGRLVFPETVKTKIETTYLIVQGQLDVTNSKTVNPDHQSLKIVLTGSTDVKWKSSVNPSPCSGFSGGKCNLGKKPFVVAGGKLNIQALPSSCVTKTTVKKTIYKKPDWDKSDFSLFEPLPDSCPTSGIVFYNYDFSTGIGNWTGKQGALTHYDPVEKSLRVSRRKRKHGSGPRIDLTVNRPDLCLVDNKRYLVTARIKLTKEGMEGMPTSCKNTTTYCPRILYEAGTPDGSNHVRQRMVPGLAPGPAAGDYGEYFYLKGYFEFESGHMGPDNIYLEMYIDGPEPGVDISIDYFDFRLPSESSFQPEDDLCGNYIMNGDAEGNELSTYPLRNNADEQFIIMEEDNGNRYFHLSDRIRYWERLYTDFFPQCLEKGVIYQLSVKLRIHSYVDESYYFQLRGYKPVQKQWFHKTLLKCPGQKRENDWVTCSGEVMIDHELSVEGLQHYEFRIVFNNQDHRYDIDIDDLSMSYKRGYMEKVLVDTDDVACYERGSDIHIHSSTNYNFGSGGNSFDSYTATITDVDTKPEGTYLTLDEPPIIPVISYEEDPEYAVELAFVSRNVIIEGADDEGNSQKGGYLQILHTPEVVQILDGVEFLNMGRKSEHDRFPIQILDSGKLEGTQISRNSIRKSNLRGISIEGTSDVKISKNVVYGCYGEGFYISGVHHLVEENMASDVKRHWPPISGTSDHNPMGFKCQNQPNKYIGNVAVACYYHGFSIRNNQYTPPSILSNISTRKMLRRRLEEDAVGVSAEQAETYEYWEAEGWTRVRHIPQRDFWYEGNDNLAGTDIRGDLRYNNASWSIDFESTVPLFDEMLFSSGTRSKWLMISKEQAIDTYYSNSPRLVLQSSISDSFYTAKWYRREGNGEDPLITMRDHSVSGADYSEFLYVENSHVNTALEGLSDEGMDVYIRRSETNKYSSIFRDNKASSNGQNGMDFSHYEKPSEDLFEGVVSIKNRYSGFKMYHSRSIAIEGSFTAENNVGVNLHYVDSARISNTDFRGYSDTSKHITKPPSHYERCKDSDFGNPSGIRLMSRRHKTYHEGKDRGATLENVTFYEFEQIENCAGGFPIEFHTDVASNRHFNYQTSFSSVTFDDTVHSPIFDGCTLLNEKGVQDVLITDIDGASDPSGLSRGPASIVSNTVGMKKFSNDDCASLSGSCMAYCPNTCMQSVDFLIDQSYSDKSSMKVTRLSDGEEHYFGGLYEYDNNINQTQYYDHNRLFSPSLPSGDYQIAFFDKDSNIMWPKFVRERWSPTLPSCEGSVSKSDISIFKPEADCSDLILNGDLEQGTTYWLHNHGSIVPLPGEGIGDSGALGYFQRTHYNHAVGQYLDTRCLSGKKDSYYEIKGYYKLTNGFECKRYGYTWGQTGDQCPTITFQKRRYTDEELKYHMTDSLDGWVGSSLVPFKKDQFNLMHGVFKVSDSLEISNRVFFYIEHLNREVGIILDDFSIIPFDMMSCDQNIIRNGDFSTGDNRYWKQNHGHIFDMVSTGDGGYAIKSSQRTRTDTSIGQEIYIDCLVAGTRYTVNAKFKLEDSSGNPIHCDLRSNSGVTRCNNLNIHSTKSGADSTYVGIGNTIPIADQSNDEWQYMTGIYTVSELHVDHSRLYIYFYGPDPSVSVIYDDIKIEPLDLDCEQLVLNPSFEDGTGSFWTITDNTRTNAELRNGGADGSDYSLKFEHERNWHGVIRQYLDSRCFVQDQEYVLTAQFQLLNKDDLTETLSCNPSQTNVGAADVCPYLYLHGSGCAGGTSKEIYILNDIDFFEWDKDSFNNFEAEIIITEDFSTCKSIQLQVGRVFSTTSALLIDNVEITQKTTFAPTPSPTFYPTVPKTDAPTSKPTFQTEAPTVLAILCPSINESNVEISSGKTMLYASETGSLCTVTKVVQSDDGKDNIIPIARSYDGLLWESAAGEYAASIFHEKPILCYAKGCQIELPPIESSNEAYIVSTTTYSLPERDQLARFLETATYGVRSDDLNALEDISDSIDPNEKIGQWVKNQVTLSVTPMTSHRRSWREGANPRLLRPESIGVSDHPCDEYSRWRVFTFTQDDCIWWMTKNIRISGTGPYLIYFNDILRSTAAKMEILDSGYEDYAFNQTYQYEVCGCSGEYVGGTISIRLENEQCVRIDNPSVNFTGSENLLTYYVDLPDDLSPVDYYTSHRGEYMLMSGIDDDAVCSALPTVQTMEGEKVFGRTVNGTWLVFDPRLNLDENTVYNPMIDGGKNNEVVTLGSTYCSNVPRSFLNEEQCLLSSVACGSSNSGSGVEITLDEATLKQFYNLTDQTRYVYAIKGLPLEDGLQSVPHPCTDNTRSRWELIDLEDCQESTLGILTNETLSTLLLESSDSNPYLRDVDFTPGLQCNETDMPELSIDLLVDGNCWRHVHPDHMSVYDMTYWTEENHPGNAVAMSKNKPHPIKKWAEMGLGFLVFPGKGTMSTTQEVNPVPIHELYRWDTFSPKFLRVGRYGDIINIRDLPNELRTGSVTQHFDELEKGDQSGVLVCGSPNEIANDKTVGFRYDAATTFRTGNYHTPGRNREYIWTMVALTAKDQLRQRVAWALSQILVIVKSEVSSEWDHAEWFVHYYDIFVRHAFGNYRDVLREISYSPMMAVNLSFLQSRSYAYMWERYGLKVYADENFAREIMQLFSIGVVLLNQDGSNKLDSSGNTIPTYTINDIMSFSRAWTGFDLQQRRGNIEGYVNYLDPMRLQSQWRDRFPKTDLLGGYIGDGYPLCVDFPDQSYLKKGALYRFLGSSNLPEALSDPGQFATDESVIKFVLDDDSELKELLCNNGGSGDCQYRTSVTLSSDLSCTGNECNVDTLRVVQVSEGVFYEYVRMPCVELAFFKNAKKVQPRYNWDPVMCANPLLPAASEACCEPNKNAAIRNVIYDGERMTLNSAEDRCDAISRTTCDFVSVSGDRHKTNSYFWTSETCHLRVKVNDIGHISMVHEPSSFKKKVMHVNNDSQNFFGVQWDNERYPSTYDECDGTCQYDSVENSCLCDISITRSRVYTSIMPKSIQEVLERLRVGAVDPSNNDDYSSTVDENTGITVYLNDNRWDTETIFAFTDDKGRDFMLKNVCETVQIKDIETGFNAGFSFRNPTHFMSLIPTEETVRDAQAETEATLDHYFYHDNTAPFITIRLIQRLVMSNPSPRYIETVSKAFKTGTFQFKGTAFGSGEYGSMEATVAAIMLDSEARNILLDKDPSHGSLREPLLKYIGLMRSMDFVTDQTVIRLEGMRSRIGQMAYDFFSVFSFFLPEFKPYGRIGDADLVAPEGTLLDMPKIVALMNGIFSLVKYGLTNCRGGFAPHSGSQCRDNKFHNTLGTLEYNTTKLSFSEYPVETFEGPSLTGGTDNVWVGYDHRYSPTGRAVEDPLDGNNHVLQFDSSHSWTDIYSPLFNAAESDIEDSIVVKFRYLSMVSGRGGGCIGYSGTDWSRVWVWCDSSRSHHGQNQMTSDSVWQSCQFEIPAGTNEFRIAIMDYAHVNSGAANDAFFDDILVTTGSGTMCGDGVVIENTIPPGKEGYSTAVVDELATLLTAGRLSTESRNVIREAYDEAGSADEGLRIAQQLILSTSEFHSTNPVKTDGEARDPFEFPSVSDNPYKAVVYMMFSGGSDSFNMLVPHTCSEKDMYEEYLNVRGEVAIPHGILLPIDAENQVCSKFGIHPELPAIQQLYNDEDLLFLSNTGVMTRPVDKSNYRLHTKTQLFAHNHMQQESKRIDPLDRAKGTGVLGRLSDVLTRKGHTVGSFSVDRFSIALVGVPGVTNAPIIVNRDGVSEFYISDNIKTLIKSLHNSTSADSGFFAETWSSSFFDSLGSSQLLSDALSTVDVNTTFPGSYLGLQLKTVSRLIATRVERGVDTDMFYIEIGGFDTHSSVEENLKNRFIEVNAAIEAFTKEMKLMNVWNNVATVQVSDFARTLNPNSGEGTDHAWGGNYMVFGGDVRGGRILGEYPDDLTNDGPLTLHRGRMIPTTPWDSVFQSVAMWMGAFYAELDEVCPNRMNFPASSLFVGDDLFNGVPPPPPTSSPTTPEPTMVPSITPSTAPSSSSAPTSPTVAPSTSPSNIHSSAPSLDPSVSPSSDPSGTPIIVPSISPSIIVIPSAKPSEKQICSDDTTWVTVTDSSEVGCGWVFKKPSERCGADIVGTGGISAPYACPTACGTSELVGCLAAECNENKSAWRNEASSEGKGCASHLRNGYDKTKCVHLGVDFDGEGMFAYESCGACGKCTEPSRPSAAPSIPPTEYPSTTPFIHPSSNPSLSLSPTMKPICSDDATWKMVTDSGDSFDCGWVFKFSTERCDEAFGQDGRQAKDACRVACSNYKGCIQPECDDSRSVWKTKQVSGKGCNSHLRKGYNKKKCAHLGYHIISRTNMFAYETCTDCGKCAV